MLIKSLETLLQITAFSVVQQFVTSAFKTVVWWHELGEVENEYISHNFSLFAKIIKIGGNFTKFWQKQCCTVFFETWCTGMLQTLLAIAFQTSCGNFCSNCFTKTAVWMRKNTSSCWSISFLVFCTFISEQVWRYTHCTTKTGNNDQYSLISAAKVTG